MDYKDMGRCAFVSNDDVNNMLDDWALSQLGTCVWCDLFLSDTEDVLNIVFTVWPGQEEEEEAGLALAQKYDKKGQFSKEQLLQHDLDGDLELPHPITLAVLSELAPKFGLKSVGCVVQTYGGYFFIEGEK